MAISLHKVGNIADLLDSVKTNPAHRQEFRTCEITLGSVSGQRIGGGQGASTVAWDGETSGAFIVPKVLPQEEIRSL